MYAQAYLWYRKIPEGYWIVTAGMIAHPWTRSQGFRMLSYGIRVTAGVAHASASSLLGTPFIRKGSWTLGRAAGVVGTGYLIGALAGTGISYHIWGAKGAGDAIDFYTLRGDYSSYAKLLPQGDPSTIDGLDKVLLDAFG